MRVLVTRAAQQAGKLSEGLRALGAVPVEVPVLEICPPASYAPLDQALERLNSYDWLILTSANTVRALTERAFFLGVSFASSASLSAEPSQPPRLFSGADQPTASASPQVTQVAAVGQATAAAAQRAGLSVTLVPESYVAESLLAEMVQVGLAGKRVLLARAAVARDVIPDALRAAGATVDVVDAYQNVLPESAPSLLRAALAEGIDAATFTSSSSASHLAEAARAAGVDWPLRGVAAVSIGPITSQTLRELGWEPAAEADPYDIPGLIAAVGRVLASKQG
jgi:uroporphyrinogen-III synthase/uroporphyrinogen III methyltransferase/synthase